MRVKTRLFVLYELMSLLDFLRKYVNENAAYKIIQTHIEHVFAHNIFMCFIRVAAYSGSNSKALKFAMDYLADLSMLLLMPIDHFDPAIIGSGGTYLE